MGATWRHWGPHHFGPHWHHHPHWEVLAKQDNSTENAVNLSAEAGWPGPWGPWGPHPHGPWGPHWHHWGPHHFGPHWHHHPHWEVLAKQDNSTEGAVNLSAEAGYGRCQGLGPCGPHHFGPDWHPHWHPHWHHHPHWEVLAKQENSTESAVSLSAEAGWPGPWGPWGPHPHGP